MNMRISWAEDGDEGSLLGWVWGLAMSKPEPDKKNGTTARNEIAKKKTRLIIKLTEEQENYLLSQILERDKTQDWLLGRQDVWEPRRAQAEAAWRNLSDARLSQGVVRAFAIITALSPVGTERRLSDLADALGMSASTTHRYVKTLVQIGLLERTASRLYRLSQGEPE